MKKIINTGLVALALSLFTGVEIFAAENTIQNGIFDLLQHEEVVDIRLTFDLKAVFADRRDDEDHEAKLHFTDAQGVTQEWDIDIRQRGKFRRTKCSELPPLKIDFDKDDLEAAGLASFDDFKLVNICMEDDEEAEESLLREYLAYKLYNRITDISYRVQLLNITYTDSRSKRTFQRLGFIIEDTAQLRARAGAEKTDEKIIIDTTLFHPQYRKTTALFQYMIGNADWMMTSSKNVKYILKEEKIFPVPYDFDFAALVEASYASYSYATGQNSFYDRVYLGFEESRAELEDVILSFHEKKDALYQTIWQFKRLRAHTRKRMLNYLDDFFANADDIKFADNGVGTGGAKGRSR